MKFARVLSTVSFLGLLIASALASPALAKDEGDLLVRMRALYVQPMDDSTDITTLGANRRVGVQHDRLVPELDFTYFWTENIGTELILGTTANTLTGKGVLGSLGNIGMVRLLPPTLTMQYHFLPKSVVSPYVGAGVNYTIFYDEQSHAALDNALGGPTDVDLDNTFGYALQGGVDIELYPGWMLNLDVKYVDISPDVTLTTNGTVRTTEVDIDPFVFGVGIGTAFSTAEWF